jgi:hypothetical protein
MIPTGVNNHCAKLVCGVRDGDDGTLTPCPNHLFPVVTAANDLLPRNLPQDEAWLNHDQTRVIVNTEKGREAVDTRYLFFNAIAALSRRQPLIGIDRARNEAYLCRVDRTIAESFGDVLLPLEPQLKPPLFVVCKKKPSDEELKQAGTEPAVFAVYSMKEQQIEALYTNAPHLRESMPIRIPSKKMKFDRIERLRYDNRNNPLVVEDVMHVQDLSAYDSVRNEQIIRVCAAIKQAMDETSELQEVAADLNPAYTGIYKGLCLFRHVLFMKDDFIKERIGE